MPTDIRELSLYREAEAIYRASHCPGSGLISDAAELSTNGVHAAFAGTLFQTLIGAPPTRICTTELESGDTRVLTFGPNTDRSPKFSPNGRQIAFLSDRGSLGDFQLYILDPVSSAVRATSVVEGWVEYLHWSPDGQRILLGVAGHGADVASGHGAVTSKQQLGERPSWMPAVETGDESFRWRRAWIYDITADRVYVASPTGLNIWEACWCGNKAIAAVTSPEPGEERWYTARLHIIELDTGSSREIYSPADQLGWPSASPSGKQLAIVEAVCSDRCIVAGDVRLIDAQSGKVRMLDTHGVDITHTEWRSERMLLIAGHRGFETVVGRVDAGTGAFIESWASRDVTGSGRYITVSGMVDGDCALIGESYLRAPEIAVIRSGEYRVVRSFDLDYATQSQAIGSVDPTTWRAPDGLEIQGWLLRPKTDAPHPLVMLIHGGPVWLSRPTWLGRGGALSLMLLQRGYALFYPNPRGSSGRGQDFARRVVGDLGGADAYDYLSGIDYLVAQGIADPRRLGVTGGSYGGYMTCWLITQDARFAAAVPVAPHTNNVSEHLLSNISHFVAVFLADHYTNISGKYFQRSPVLHAHKTKTPTLNICGALDRCTPAEEAMQFHNALLENRVESVLVTYPEEGHGVRKFPAMIDYAARIVAWFEEHMDRAS